MDLKELTKRLVAIRSITKEVPDRKEVIREELLAIFNELGYNDIEEFVHNNVISFIIHAQTGDGPKICFNGHYDTVPIQEGWSTDPFQLLEIDGWWHGLGATDMKSGLAVSLLAGLQSSNAEIDIMVVGDEETGGHNSSKLLAPRKGYDLVIIHESTPGGGISKGERGIYQFIKKIKGKGSHASDPTKAINPIEKGYQMFKELKDLCSSFPYEYESEMTTASLTYIKSGSALNVIPETAEFGIDIRYGKEASLQKIKELVASYEGNIIFELLEGPRKTPDTELIKTYTEVMKKYSTNVWASGLMGGTDGRFFDALGIPTIVVGPANHYRHCANERVLKSEVESLLKVDLDFLKSI